jgi:hypothetical protein
MTFFYDLNKRLADLAKKQDAKQISEDAKATAPKSKLAESMDVAEAGYSAKAGRAGKDLGKPGKNFSKIAKSAGEKYGSKAAGERVAGAVLNKLRHPKESTDESAFQAAIGKKKYGDEGMKALQKAGREHAGKEKMASIRNKYDKYDESQGMTDEGNAFTGALAKTPKGGKFKVGNKEFTDTSSLEEVGMTPKQKSFAKLAPPTDKITFADKIAGAKKEVDEMLGDVAADAIKSAVGKKKIADESERSSSGGTIEKTKHGIRHIAGKRYSAMDVSDERDDDDEDDGRPKKKGRPAGSKRKIGAKGPTGKSKLLKKDAIKEGGNKCPHCGHSMDDEEELDEKAVSKKQQKFMGMVHAAQKGEKPASKEVSKVAKTMKKSDAEDFAATKHKGLPEKVKAKKEESKKEVEETSDAPKAGKGMQFGKGIYESLDKKLEKMIAEGINITTNMGSEEGTGETRKSITVSADGEDADKLAELLKMAGLESHKEVCPGCGSSDCGCEEELDENSPDWPTNTETSNNALQYSGGLNKPKSTGQTTTPVIASQLRRQVSMEESVELERSLFKLYKDYKTK